MSMTEGCCCGRVDGWCIMHVRTGLPNTWGTWRFSAADDLWSAIICVGWSESLAGHCWGHGAAAETLHTTVCAIAADGLCTGVQGLSKESLDDINWFAVSRTCCLKIINLASATFNLSIKSFISHFLSLSLWTYLRIPLYYFTYSLVTVLICDFWSLMILRYCSISAFNRSFCAVILWLVMVWRLFWTSNNWAYCMALLTCILKCKIFNYCSQTHYALHISQSYFPERTHIRFPIARPSGRD